MEVSKALFDFLIIDLGCCFPHFLRKVLPDGRLFFGVDFTGRSVDKVRLTLKNFGARGGRRRVVVEVVGDLPRQRRGALVVVLVESELISVNLENEWSAAAAKCHHCQSTSRANCATSSVRRRGNSN